jgi:hypothetical protein
MPLLRLTSHWAATSSSSPANATAITSLLPGLLPPPPPRLLLMRPPFSFEAVATAPAAAATPTFHYATEVDVVDPTVPAGATISQEAPLLPPMFPL